MSSRNQVIHIITLALFLLLVPGSVLGLWIKATEPHHNNYNNNNEDALSRAAQLVGNDYSIDNGAFEEEEGQADEEPTQQIPRMGHAHRDRDVMGPWTQQQALLFLEKATVDHQVHRMAANLRNLLKENSDEDLPIVYEDSVVEDEESQVGEGQQAERANVDGNALEDGDEDVFEYDLDDNGQVLGLHKAKRSGRYYRRYPFKRRNNRYYEQPKHNCKPSREEVVKLLVALHKYQTGNKDRKMVRFCKRNRPLGNIITNMRFLG